MNPRRTQQGKPSGFALHARAWLLVPVVTVLLITGAYAHGHDRQGLYRTLIVAAGLAVLLSWTLAMSSVNASRWSARQVGTLVLVVAGSALAFIGYNSFLWGTVDPVAMADLGPTLEWLAPIGAVMWICGCLRLDIDRGATHPEDRHGSPKIA